MKDIQIMTISEFRRSFGYVLDKVSEGNTVTVTNHHKPWVKLTPPPTQVKGERNVSAFELRNNTKKHFDAVHHLCQQYLVTRKGEAVATIIACEPSS